MNQGRKTVLFLITKATWGGAQRYVFDLATHLPPEFQAIVAYGEKGKLADDLKTAGIRIRELPSLGRDIAIISDFKSFFEIIGCVRRARPDTIHLNSSKAAAFGSLAARLYGVRRIVFTVHGWPFKEDRNGIAKALIYFISWSTALLSHATIVVSNEDERIGKRMWLVGKKIHHVPIGIEMPTFLSREEASARLSIATNAPRIVTIAEFTKNKGISYAIDAIAELKKKNVACEYFIIGDGELRTSLEQQVAKLDLADRVRFLGFVADASNYLKAFDVFVLPSIKEGMPYVLLEATAAEMPIIATNVIDPSFATATIAPADARALAGAIERSIEKPPTKPALSTFILEEMAAKTVALY